MRALKSSWNSNRKENGMKRILLLLVIFVFNFSLKSQIAAVDTSGYNLAYWNALADKKHYSGAMRAEFIDGLKKLYIRSKSEQDFHSDSKDLIWVEEPSTNGKFSGATINAGPCTNIDFESGNVSGWVQSNGYNPLFNVAGCCNLTNAIDQTMMTGGTDPFGGFPRVWPGGGGFSLRLGSTTTGGRADRIQQTFFVTPANANFTYRYAVVLNDGGSSHTTAQQPRFTIEMIDTLGNQVPCTFYNISAGANVPGYQTSSLTANNTAVIYKDWTSVVIDLSPNIGQNVTLRFTAYDCGPSGHFAYAYIDGTCTNFQTSVADTTCPNIPFSMCAPIGFGNYQWNGPGIVNNTGQCINVTAPGVYTCQTVLVPGCPGPVFTHTLSLRPNPVISFTPSSLPCANQFSFNSTSSISIGSIGSYTYSFGDGSGTFLQSPIHNYPGPGAYNVKFKAFSAFGCRDSVSQIVYVYPQPSLSFSPPSHCINTLVQFTNTSVIPTITGVPAGSVVSYTWNLGNGQTSNLPNPTNTYTSSGTYTITLSATSNQGCISTLTQTLGIFPPPVINFSANPLCDINGTSFSPSTTTAITSGSIVSYYWDFGDGGTSILQTPLHIYNAPGIYTVSYTGTSNHNCVLSVVKVLTISPTPTVAFSTFSVNACTPNFTFVNTTTLSAGIPTYTWSFGGTNTTTATNVNYTFPAAGNYTVSLIGMSPLGCTDTALAFISIFPFPIVTISAPAPCESAIFSGSSTAVTGSVTSYNWNFGDPPSGAANTSTLQNPTHQFPSVGTYTLSLQIVSNQNCSSTFTVALLVRPNPITTFNSFPPDACTPSYTFVNNSGFAPNAPSGNVIVNSLWNFNGATTSSVNAPTYTFPGPGIYTVSLKSTTNYNCTATDIKTVSIYPYPQSTISAIPACLNIAAIYNGSINISQNPGPGTVTSYTWNFGDGILDNNLNTTHFYLTSGTYPISFSATSNQGCVTTATTSLIVYPTPSLSFNTINPCAGSAFTFSNTSTIPAGNFITGYKWDYDGDGIANSNAANPIFTFTSAGVYTVQLYGISNYNCKDSISKTVSVFDIPKPAITSSNVCFGTPTPFTASTSLPGAGAQLTNFTWVLGANIPIQNTQSGGFIYSSPGVYTLQLTATNNFSCSATTSSIVQVHQMPVSDFTTRAVCLNTATSFTNLSFINAPDVISQFSWNFGSGFVNGLNRDTTKLYASPGAYIVTLQVKSNKQCVSAKTMTVLVHDNPNAAFSNSLVCVGDKINFTNLSSSADGTITSNAWDFEGDNIVNQDVQIPNFVYPALGMFPVTLKVTTNYGCTSVMTRSIFANPKAVPSFTSDLRSGCPELCVNFQNLSSLVKGSYTSLWDFGDGTSPSGFFSPKHCYSEGNFSVKLQLRTDSGCVSSAINNGYMTVYPNPVAAFNVKPEEIDEDDPTILVENGSSADVTFIKYYVSDGSSFGTPNFNHYIKNMERKVKPLVVQVVKNQFGCADTLTKMLEIKPTFALYVPNVFTPNTDGRNDGFQAKGVGITKFAMQIYDRWGHMVWETKDFTDSWDGSVKQYENAAKEDVYTWKAQVVDLLNRNHNLVGHVTLLR
jgi:gliding motility-associated-like protein